MGVEVHVDDSEVVITFTGWDQLWALSGGVTLGIDEITDARVLARRDAVDGLGIRVGGGYWPGSFATGHFTHKGRRGAFQLWSVYRDEQVLAIDTTRSNPSRVVVQHPDRDFLAWIINERVRADHRA
jgi:hypothetical protein